MNRGSNRQSGGRTARDGLDPGRPDRTLAVRAGGLVVKVATRSAAPSPSASIGDGMRRRDPSLRPACASITFRAGVIVPRAPPPSCPSTPGSTPTGGTPRPGRPFRRRRGRARGVPIRRRVPSGFRSAVGSSDCRGSGRDIAERRVLPDPAPRLAVEPAE